MDRQTGNLPPKLLHGTELTANISLLQLWVAVTVAQSGWEQSFDFSHAFDLHNVARE